MTENSDAFSGDVREAFADPIVLSLLIVSWTLTIFMIIVTLVFVIRCSKRRTKHRHRLVDRGSAERLSDKRRREKAEKSPSKSGSKSQEVSGREKQNVVVNGEKKDDRCDLRVQISTSEEANQMKCAEKCFAERSDERTYPSQQKMERTDLSADRHSRQQSSTATESKSKRKKRTLARLKDMVNELASSGHSFKPDMKNERIDDTNRIEPTQASAASELHKSRKIPQ